MTARFVVSAFLLAALPALAQTVPNTPDGARPGNIPGTGQSLPLSDRASNITQSDTTSPIAPRLPSPDVSESAPPRVFLEAARRALAANRTGEAQEAMERAESRALSRSVAPSRAGDPSRQSLVRQIAEARGALATGDRGRSISIIETAIANPEAGEPPA